MTLRDRERYAPGMKTQLDRFHAALADGMPRLGWKVGINVPEVLGHLKLTHSGIGWLDGRKLLATGAEIIADHAGETIEKHDLYSAVSVGGHRGRR